jgi:beta-glucosidase-like glycosyl hydrolase
MQLRLENARKGGSEKEVASCEQSLHDRAKLIDTLENERSRLVAQYAALKEFLPEARQARFAGIDASPIPPEWLTYMKDAIELTINTLHESRLTASIQQLRDFKGLRTEYDKLLKQQQDQIERERIEHTKAKKAFEQEVTTLTKSLSKEISPEEKVAIRMKISFIKQFYYKLHDAAITELQTLAAEHQKQEEPLRAIKYPKV